MVQHHQAETAALTEPARKMEPHQAFQQRSNIGDTLNRHRRIEKAKGATEVSQSLTEGGSYHLGLGSKSKRFESLQPRSSGESPTELGGGDTAWRGWCLSWGPNEAGSGPVMSDL